MKKKWLIGIASSLLAVTMAFGLAACGDDDNKDDNPGGSQSGTENPGSQGGGSGNEGGSGEGGSGNEGEGGGGSETEKKTDAEIAEEVISTLKVEYLDDAETTAFDYQVFGQVKIDGVAYKITWTASTDAEGVTIGDLVKIGAMDESTKMVTISVTRTDAEVTYKLIASVTVGDVTKTVDFTRKLPATAGVHGDVVFNFDAVKFDDHKTTGDDGSVFAAELTLEQVREIMNTAGGANHGATITEASKVYAGNVAGQGGIEFTDGYLKFGSGSVNGKLTLTFPKAVNKVEIGVKGWTDTNESGSKIDTVSVNGSAAQTPPVDYNSLLTFDVDPTTTITIETAKRVFIFGIAVSYAPADAHVHVGDGNFVHLEGTWQHQEGCTAANCTNGGKLPAVDCEPVNNKCNVCNTTYTVEQILARVESGAAMKGTYELTGVITSDSIKESEYNANNVMFYMNVTVGTATKSVQAFYVTVGTGIDKSSLKKGDTVTIRGPLTYYQSKTIEFNGGTITNYVDGAASMSDQEKAAAALTALKLDTMATEYYAIEDFDLPTTTQYSASVEWTVKTDANSRVEIKNKNTLSVKSLPKTGEESIVLTVTVTVGDKTATQNVTIKLTPERAEMVFTPLANTPTAGTYYLAMKVQDGQYYYITGGMSGFYMATTTDSTKAVQVILTGDNTNGYTLKTTAGKFIEITVGEHINAVYQNAQTEGKVWKWDDTYHILTWEEGGKKYFLETFDSNTTIGAGAYDTYVTSPTTWKAVLGTLAEHTDAVKVKEVADALEEPDKLEFFAADKNVENTLTTETELSLKYHATIAWSVSDELKSYITIADGKLTVTSLPADAAVTGKLIATVTIGEGDDAKTATHEFTVTLNKADETPKMFKAADELAARSYLFSVVYKGDRRYVSDLQLDKGETGYLKTTEDVADAVQITLEASGSNWLIKLGDKYLEVNPYTNTPSSGDPYTSYNLRLVATATETAVWEWDTSLKILKQKPVATGTLTTTVADAYYYLGMRDDKTFTTLSPSDIKYLSSTPGTNHAAQFGTLVDMTEEDMAKEVLASIKLEQTTFTEENTDGIDLPAPNDYGATVEWKVTDGTSEYVSVSGGKLLINHLPTGNDEKIDLTVTVTVGESTVSKTVEITVQAAPAEGADTSELLATDISGKEHNASLDGVEFTAEKVKVTFGKGTNKSNNPIYYSKSGTIQIRFYQNNNITVNTDEGFLVTKITMSFVANGNCEMTTTVGSIAPVGEGATWAGKPTSVEWTGKAATVVITLGSGSGYYMTGIAFAYEPTTHEHDYHPAHVADTFTHKMTCANEDCYDPEYKEPCTLVNNKCSVCNEQYTEQQIVDALFKLDSGKSLPGSTYQLSGKVMRIDEEYSSQFHNVTFTIKVTVGGADKYIKAYRTSGESAATVKPGDTVTVKGALKRYNSDYEFDGGTIISHSEGTLTPQEKVDEVKRWLKLPDAVSNEITLPTVPEWAEGVTLAWQSDKEAVVVGDGKLTITPQDAADTATITVTIKHAEVTPDVTTTFEVSIPSDAEEMANIGLTANDRKANRKSYTASTAEVWEANGITFTHTKGGSTNVAEQTQVRVYKSDTIKLELTVDVQRINSIVFHLSKTDYISPLVATLGTIQGATVTSNTSAMTVTITWDAQTNVTSFTSGAFTAAVWIESIDVTYIASPAAAAAAISAPVADLPHKD